MICPACKTNNTKHQDAEFCVQCGSDLNVHRLLQAMREGIQMKNEEPRLEQIVQKKSSNIWVILQIIPSMLFLICTVFGIFVGMQFLTFLESAEANSKSANARSGFKQLQQMSSIIQRELDLIIDQRQENKALQEKVQELTTVIATAANRVEATIPPVVQEDKL